MNNIIHRAFQPLPLHPTHSDNTPQPLTPAELPAEPAFPGPASRWLQPVEDDSIIRCFVAPCPSDSSLPDTDSLHNDLLEPAQPEDATQPASVELSESASFEAPEALLDGDASLLQREAAQPAVGEEVQSHEVQMVRAERMAQLQRQRQASALASEPAYPHWPSPRPPQQAQRGEADSLASLLVMLDAMASAEQAETEAASDCMGGGGRGDAARGGGVVEVVDEVVVVVAGDRSGRSMLIEMHHQI